MRDFFTETGKLDNQTIRDQVVNLAKNLKQPIDLDLINNIIDQFWFHDFYNSFIADKIYFDYLLQYLTQRKFKQFNRFEYYGFLFDKLIPKNEQDCWHRIALSFESRQTDRLKPEEYNQLIKQLVLSEKIYGVSVLTKKHLAKLDKVEGIEYLIWEHHTFTEFLAAEYLLGKDEPIEEFKKLAILKQEGIIAFKPSWSGVLRFLLESNKQAETLNWLISFLEQYPDNLDDELGELISFIVDKPNSQTKTRIFNLIYNSYFKRLTWIPVWTRNNLNKFIDDNAYKRLKTDIKKWGNKTETFVRRGNVAAIIGGLLENNNAIINSREKEFWKKIFIKFIVNPNDDGNGVLQRHCLYALENYKDENIIKQLEPLKLLESQDSLVREAFVELCYSVLNSKIAINNLIEGLKKGSDIYARHGLYKITSKQSLKYFLSKISEDEQFLKAFLNHESIFDKEDGDWQIIKRIKKLKGKETVLILKKLFFNFFKLEYYRYLDKSNFVKQIGLVINKLDKNFLLEILKDIKSTKQDEIFYRFIGYENFIALILTPENVETYFKAVDDLQDQVKNQARFVPYIAKRLNGETGDKVYRKSVQLKRIKPLDAQPKEQPWEKQQKHQKKAKLIQFIKLLGKEDTFFTDLFQYYLQNKDEINEFFKTSKGKIAKQRLIKLAVNGIKKIDPRKFIVTIPDKVTKKFTWSVPASYFGDLLDIINLFAPKLIKKYRQKLIDFIPYAFSDDMGRIMEMIDKISDKELEFVNNAMKDLKDDRRYLVPGTYIYLIGHYAKKGCKLPSVKPAILSFINDELLPDYERRNSLENLEFVIEKSDKSIKPFLNKLFKESKDENLRKIANALLISLYKDEQAIDWRFNQLKQPIKFDKRKIEGIEHSVSPEERELDTLDFAKPLIELQDTSYIPKFLELIQESVKILLSRKTKFKFQAYSEYLLKIALTFFNQLKNNRSFNPLSLLKSYAAINLNRNEFNWVKAKISNLRLEYVNEIGKHEGINIEKKFTKQEFDFVIPKETRGKKVNKAKKLNYSPILKNIKSLPKFERFIKNKKLIFISHSSSSDIPQGVKNFSYDLVKKIQQHLGEKNIFFDKNEALTEIDKELSNALKRSKYIVIICTEEYIKKSGINSHVADEISHFNQLRRNYNKNFFIPVLFGIDYKYFQVDGIYGLKDLDCIPVNIDSSQSQYYQEKNRVASKVISYIKNLDKKNKLINFK